MKSIPLAMGIFRTYSHLQALKVFPTLPFFFWIHSFLCRATMPAGPVQSNVEVCLSYCTLGTTQVQIFQFCQCMTGLKTDGTTSLLQTWGQTDVVGIHKYPVVNTYICQAMCQDLAECEDWHYEKLRALCVLGNQDPRQTTSLATKGWESFSTTSQGNDESSAATSPPMVTSSRSKHPNMSLSPRTNDGNGGTTLTTPGTPSQGINSTSVTKPNNATGPSNRKVSKPNHKIIKTISKTFVIRRISLPKIKIHTSFEKTSFSCRRGCPKPLRTCLNGQCVCRAGFAEQPQDKSCSKDCQLFSANFTLQSTTRCSKKYFKKHSGVGEAGCQELCVSVGRRFCAAYQLKDGNCYLLDRGGAWPKVQWEDHGTCRYFQRNCEAHTVATCDNCKDEGHRCNNGVCECDLGYSEVRGSSRCVKECPLYSNEFTMQSRRLCQTIHHTLYRDVTVDECREKCLSKDLDLCLAYEYRHHTCFLMTKRWIDKYGPWEDWTECSHYQRVCKTCDDTCVAPHYVCDGGLCHCNLGNSKTRDNKCVKGCNTFTKTFTKSAQTKCMKNYPVSHSSSSPEECRKKCLNEKFKCVAFSFDGKKCGTVMWDKLSYNPTDWYYSQSCAHYTRQCDHKGGDCLTTCRHPNYICKDRKCVCNTGYNITEDGKCVKGCRYFKDSFSLQEAGMCLRKFQKKYYGRDADWCRRKCLKSSFLCGSFEIYQNYCYTIKWKEKYYQPEFLKFYDNCKHYSRNCKYKGSDCDVCDGPQYRCRDKTCVCSRGYSFVVGVATCHKECVSYAPSFTKQSTYHCVRSYEKKYSRTTAADCEHKCRHEQDFICGAFHYYKGNCYTMKWNMKSLEKTWEHKSRTCEHYTRDCNPNCEIGHSLIPDKNRCVLDCSVYSDKFQKQSDFVCVTDYHRKLKDTSRRKCEQICVETENRCDGYEIYKNACFIITEDKGPTAEWKVYDGCTHYQRICKH